MIENTFMDTSDYKSLVILRTHQVIMEDDLDSEYDKPFYAFYKRPLWAFKRAPPFVSPDIRDPTQVRSIGIFSIPTYCYMLDLSMD